jgi:archaemetzincin
MVMYHGLGIVLEYCFICLLLFSGICCGEKNESDSHISKTDFKLDDFRKLGILHSKIPAPGPDDWLFHHKESGQSYANYCSGTPVRPDAFVNKIYILPIGEFSPPEQILLEGLAKYLEIFFMLKVVLLQPVHDRIVPEEARRYGVDVEQLHTFYILNQVLLPQRPDDAICLISITNKDLYPGEGWNFVFGQASLSKRVGVSSYYRFINDFSDTSAYRKCFERIIKTTSHELCHMFSIKHCRIYECLMNGANHLQEADRTPLWLCPECLAKLQWCIRFRLIERYRLLNEFFGKKGFDKESEFYTESISIMTG